MRYLDILDCDLTNGQGVRVTLFVSGCNHHCKGCQNPESWNPNNGKEFTDETKQKLFKLLERDYIDGISYSGGDPLFPSNRDTLTQLAKEIKERFPNKTQWLWTGYKYEEIKDLEIIKYLNVLIDGEYVEELRDLSLPYRGSSNQRIIWFSGPYPTDEYWFDVDTEHDANGNPIFLQHVHIVDKDNKVME